jgi:hypothetical protein
LGKIFNSKDKKIIVGTNPPIETITIGKNNSFGRDFNTKKKTPLHLEETMPSY